ncbi:hypothetical protein PIECOFPK_00634 [Mycovorax composti]|jgi:CDP-diglyceride synthetase|uniref:Phosphatidate cytidylyltransferase n=2 Tax=Chitinophagaceae TaxID=563835 RepID=A0ABZ2EI36_9BACT
MAFNWTTFWTRTFTALIFVAVMAAGLLGSYTSFFALITIIHFGCWYEYLKLIDKIHATRQDVFVHLGFALLGFHIVLLFGDFYFLGYHVARSFSFPFLVAGLVFIIWGIFRQAYIHKKALGIAALGLLYISLSVGLLLYMRLSQYPLIKDSGQLWGHENGFYVPIIIILAIWINDTMAYLVGSAIGKTPFSKISPKKTLEGTLSGMILCVAAITLILQPFFNWPLLLGISLMVSVFGTLGDLLESKIKRMAGVKDSGRIMPGHGGFLDRFDSLLIAVPAVWMFLELVNYLLK